MKNNVVYNFSIYFLAVYIHWNKYQFLMKFDHPGSFTMKEISQSVLNILIYHIEKTKFRYPPRIYIIYQCSIFPSNISTNPIKEKRVSILPEFNFSIIKLPKFLDKTYTLSYFPFEIRKFRLCIEYLWKRKLNSFEEVTTHTHCGDDEKWAECVVLAEKGLWFDKDELSLDKTHFLCKWRCV